MALHWLGEKLHLTHDASHVHGKEARSAAHKFDEEELYMLKKTWEDLADRTNGKGIDKDTFLQYFPVTGLLGERLFDQFCRNKEKGSNVVDFSDFIYGLSICSRGTWDEKIHFVFSMFDASKTCAVTQEELETLLNQIPRKVLLHAAHLDTSPKADEQEKSFENDGAAGSSSSDKTPDKKDNKDALSSQFEDLDLYTNHDFAQKAFDECDLNHEGRLSYKEFKLWIENQPAVIEYLEDMLPYSSTIPGETTLHGHSLSSKAGSCRQGGSLSLSRQGSLEGMTRSGSHPNLHKTMSQEEKVREVHANQIAMLYNSNVDSMHRVRSERDRASLSAEKAGRDSPDHSEHDVMLGSYSSMDSTDDSGGLLDVISVPRMDTEDIYKALVDMEGYLSKRGQSIFHLWSKRYYLLSGSILYYYSSKEDTRRPKGVIFLLGSLVERVSDPNSEARGFYGFEICHQDMCTGEHHRHEKRVLYCSNAIQRDLWVTKLQHAAHVVPVEDDYVIGSEIGKGRFSTVYECVKKDSGESFAVKVIDKSKLGGEEKELLRTEIAILKLVNHPNIIRMQGQYEDKKNLYIVTERLEGGELFDRISGRPRFSEDEARPLMRSLIGSVAYLHDLGIVHRDIKPENILCGDNLEDLKIADFGLSKTLLPHDHAMAACGTLSYVAPEVLTMRGYGKEADMWSVGVIMYLILCGRLPFDGHEHNEIIRNTVSAELKTNIAAWKALSGATQDFLQSLLTKEPQQRITARAAMKHSFFTESKQ
jgi:Ca2+-binding EF-hand superfamily protein